MLMWLIAGASLTAIDAERALARDAQRIGQWTAFRKYAGETAVMFNPQAAWAHDILPTLKNPPKAASWSASQSWVSCDGRTALNRGPWTSPTGGKGHFTSVWVRGDKGWRWAYKSYDSHAKPSTLPMKPRINRARCDGRSKLPQEYREEVKPTARIAGKPPGDGGQGRSADGTLIYEWKVSASGERRFQAKLWNGREYSEILDEEIRASQWQ